jgi:RNA-directed DNA polymerase
MKAFFDTIDHDLMMKAVNKHVDESWLRLYTRRWFEAPVQTEGGKIEVSTRGHAPRWCHFTFVSKSFLHYAFDMWVSKQFPNVRLNAMQIISFTFKVQNK